MTTIVLRCCGCSNKFESVSKYLKTVKKQAARAGWTERRQPLTPDSARILNVCPDCAKREEARKA